MRLPGLPALLLLIGCRSSERAAPADPPPQSTRLEVCPQLMSLSIYELWIDELWPRCPLASPISSWGGRCIDNPGCMKPCRRTRSHQGVVSEDARFTYDAQGNLVAVELTAHAGGLPSKSTATCEYDARGRTTRCEKIGLVTEYTYDGDRLVSTTRTDEGQLYRSERFEYDEQGRLSIATSQLDTGPGPRLTYSYNADGTVRVAGERDRTTTFVYKAGRLVRTEDHDGARVELDYDAAGRVRELAETGPAASRVTYEYDGKGRLVRETSVGIGRFGVTATTTFEYECN